MVSRTTPRPAPDNLAQLGIVTGEAGFLRLEPGLVRAPDVAFIPSSPILDRQVLRQQVVPLAPDLAVEIFSPRNARGEIQVKLPEYFLAGTRLVCVIQPKTRAAQRYTSPIDRRRVGKNGSLDAGPVLPGFTLSLADLFAELDEPPGPQQ